LKLPGILEGGNYEPGIMIMSPELRIIAE